MRLQAYIAAGWSPVLAVATTNGSDILEVVGWQGGFGSAPSTGLYVGSTGYVSNITDGIDIRGAAGAGASLNVSAGTTSNNLNTLVFGNSNGVSFGLNIGTITASVFTNYQSTGNYLTTAAQSNQVVNSLNGSTGQISLNVGSSLSSSTNGSSITFGLASNITTALQSAGNYLTTAAQSNQVVNSLNGSTGQISLNVGSSLSSSTNGSSITFGLASNITTALQSAGAYLTTAAQSNQVVNSLNGKTGQISLVVGSSLSSSTNGSTITFGLASNITTALQSAGNYLTTAAQSNQVVNSLNGSTGQISLNVGSSLSSSTNGSSITLGLASNITTALQSAGAYLTTAMQSNAATISNILISAGASSSLVSAITFSNANGISFGYDGTNVTASVGAGGAAGSIAVPGTTFALGQLIFSNSNGVSFGINGSTLTASAAGGAGGGVAIAASNTTFATGTVVLSNNGGALTIGSAAQSVLFSVPSVSSLSGLGMASISTNGSTIFISVAEVPKSYWANMPLISAMNTSVLGGSSNLVEPFLLPYDISASFLRIPVSVPAFAQTTFATSANTTIGVTQNQTLWANIYSLGTGANSGNLQYITGASLVMGLQITGQIGAASNNQSVGQTITYGISGNTSSFTSSYGVNSASINFSSANFSGFTGNRWMDLPLAASLSGGNYWVAFQKSSAVTTVGTAGMANVTSQQSHFAISQINSNFAVPGGNATVNTNQILLGLGVWSTNSSGATSSTLGLNNVVTQANNMIIPFQLIRNA